MPSSGISDAVTREPRTRSGLSSPVSVNVSGLTMASSDTPRSACHAVEVERRGLQFHDVLRRQRLPDEHEARRIAIRQRPQQDAVEQREDGAVDADPERERQDDEQREPGPAEGIPDGEGEVVDDQIELQGLTPEIHGVGNRAGRSLNEAARVAGVSRVVLKLGVPLALPLAALPSRHEPRGRADQGERQSQRRHRACLGRRRDAASS